MGEAPDSKWVTAQIGGLNKSGNGLVAVVPAALSMRRLGMSFNRLMRDGATGCDLTLTSETGSEKRLAIEFNGSVARDLATNAVLPEGVYWFLSTQARNSSPAGSGTRRGHPAN